MFWDRRETYPERRLANIRRESRLVGKDIEDLTRTVRSGGEVPAPDVLRSEEWRRREAVEAETEMLPDWFPRPGPDGTEPARSQRGLVRDERLVSYLASNFQPLPTERAEDHEEPENRKWVLVGLVVVLVILYSLARHWM